MSQIETTLKKAEDMLETARCGFEDLAATNKSRRIIGLRNLIVFGRTVTFVLQNLRSEMAEGEFDKWYAPKQEEMKKDAVMKHFVKLRNELEKQGNLPVSTSVQMNGFSFSDIDKYKKPPGTVGFFIGDQFGGSGFEVEMADGSKEKYYVDLPEDKVKVTQHFSNFPDHIENMTIEEASDYYLGKLSKLVAAARDYFIGSTTKKPLKRRAHLRVVK
jgi:hypothetical protein